MDKSPEIPVNEAKSFTCPEIQLRGVCGAVSLAWGMEHQNTILPLLTILLFLFKDIARSFRHHRWHYNNLFLSSHIFNYPACAGKVHHFPVLSIVFQNRLSVSFSSSVSSSSSSPSSSSSSPTVPCRIVFANQKTLALIFISSPWSGGRQIQLLHILRTYITCNLNEISKACFFHLLSLQLRTTIHGNMDMARKRISHFWP